MSNSADIDVTYGVSNAFYQLWLDKRMTYTCALFESDADTLEAAQTRKLEYHYAAARVKPESRVLDIGCGWGSNLEFLAVDKGVRDVAGITISSDQVDYIEARAIRNVSAELISYEHYSPKQLFDAVISIGMFEHIATPEEARAGTHIDKYREYFRRAWTWTQPGAWFSLQTVITTRVPRGELLRELAWATRTIFPGAITPTLEAVVRASLPYWEVVEVHTRREHYAKTTGEWLRRLRAHREEIVSTWGEALFTTYERYLSACVSVFSQNYQSLAQLALRRID